MDKMKNFIILGADILEPGGGSAAEILCQGDPVPPLDADARPQGQCQP